ncbi:MAG: biotin--[acetyl-CoA-carboxylase] ligase [Bacteroidetes bacterium]|nr:biotin--[acetyl-CoA-carboxylase] ligase [Bacteroidota bacterium]
MQTPLFTGTHRIHLQEVGSTNTYLKELIASKDLSEGSAITASHQSEGRGQLGAEWNAEPDSNITTSILYHPKFLLAEEQFLLSRAVALGVREFIQKLLPDELVQIKWPNDIRVLGKKISGILIENSLAGNFLSTSVIGIGININEAMRLETAISLHDITGRYYNLEELYPVLFSCLEAQYLQLKSNKKEAVKKDYLKHFYGLHQEVNFTDTLTQESFIALIAGVTEEGKLILQYPEGVVRFIDLKEVRFV